MKTTIRYGDEASSEPAIEETKYGPPQHSMRGGDPEGGLYGAPQHETDVVVNAEPRESRVYRRYWEAAYDARPRFVPGRRTVVSP
ncbi:hypothetical protein [Haladaptatus sp. DYF46]|uniref:hypothetical protein n=1 Tax=Haladaptatus sp. DYF46 TaxID=2886041 RepID=UPI001E4B737C|nr:hypothetical protein [Haladaptatus sp. DYF46]